jgi:hypothetical protein
MKIFDFLYGRKNITHKWVSNPDISVKVNLNPILFGGIALGESVDKLSYLGSSDNSYSTRNMYFLEYEKYGFDILLNENYTMQNVMIYIFNDIDKSDKKEMFFRKIMNLKNSQNFNGIWKHGNTVFNFDKFTTPSQIQNILGKPFKINKEIHKYNYLIYNYTFNNIEIQFSWVEKENNYLFESVEIGQKGTVFSATL